MARTNIVLVISKEFLQMSLTLFNAERYSVLQAQHFMRMHKLIFHMIKSKSKFNAKAWR